MHRNPFEVKSLLLFSTECKLNDIEMENNSKLVLPAHFKLLQ